MLKNVHNTRMIVEFGVVFLLFNIGLWHKVVLAYGLVNLSKIGVFSNYCWLLRDGWFLKVLWHVKY